MARIMRGLTLYRGMGRGGLRGNDLGVIFATTLKDEAMKYADWGSGRGPGGLATIKVHSEARILDLTAKENVVGLLKETGAIYRRSYARSLHQGLYWTPEDFTPDFIDGVADEIIGGGQAKEGMGQLSVFDDKFVVRALKSLGCDAATDGETYVFTKPSLLQVVAIE